LAPVISVAGVRIEFVIGIQSLKVGMKNWKYTVTRETTEAATATTGMPGC
jgi:hypothetical protein